MASIPQLAGDMAALHMDATHFPKRHPGLHDLLDGIVNHQYDVHKVKKLIDKGVNVNSRCKGRLTILMVATDSKNPHRSEIIEYLLQSGARLDLEDQNGYNALLHSCRSGHLDVLVKFLEAGADVNSADDDRQSALMIAAVQGYDAIVESLVQAGANVNAKDHRGWTALMGASQEGNQNIVKVLLKAGANIEMVATLSKTSALMAATQRGHSDIVLTLLQAGSSIDAVDHNNVSPLAMAAYRGHNRVVDTLLEAGANVDIVANNGFTALMLAAQGGYKRIVKSLIQANAHVGDPTDPGNDAYVVAYIQGHYDIILLLQNAKEIRKKFVMKKSLEQQKQKVDEKAMGEGGSPMLGFPKGFLLQPSTPEVDKSAGKNASTFQEEINKQNSDMRENIQGAVDAFLKNVCQKCFTSDVCCQCTDGNAKNTTGNKKGFKGGVKPSGPASRRNNKK